MKRTDYWDWDTTFMAIADVVANRSKDPRTQVGAIIVNKDNIITSIGYNGFPRGIDDDKWPWDAPQKYMVIVHAEANAILNSNQQSLKDCKLYVPFFTCNECAKLIIQSGIREVIYRTDYYYDEYSMVIARQMYDLSGVTYRQVKRTIK